MHRNIHAVLGFEPLTPMSTASEPAFVLNYEQLAPADFMLFS